MKFVLKQYDTELLSFDLRSEGLDGFVCTVLKKSEKNRRLFPLGLKLTDQGLLDWLKSRVIPRNREFVDKILSVYGLDHNNILGIVKLCMGLSVNDSYWIVPDGFEGKFKDYIPSSFMTVSGCSRSPAPSSRLAGNGAMPMAVS